jgi:hypothetical protein
MSDELKAAAQKAVDEAAKAPKRKVDPGSVRYDNGSGADVEAIWKECGKDKVKALGPARHKMTFDQIRAACK